MSDEAENSERLDIDPRVLRLLLLDEQAGDGYCHHEGLMLVPEDSRFVRIYLGDGAAQFALTFHFECECGVHYETGQEFIVQDRSK